MFWLQLIGWQWVGEASSWVLVGTKVQSKLWSSLPNGQDLQELSRALFNEQKRKSFNVLWWKTWPIERYPIYVSSTVLYITGIQTSCLSLNIEHMVRAEHGLHFYIFFFFFLKPQRCHPRSQSRCGLMAQMLIKNSFWLTVEGGKKKPSPYVPEYITFMRGIIYAILSLRT